MIDSRQLLMFKVNNALRITYRKRAIFAFHTSLAMSCYSVLCSVCRILKGTSPKKNLQIFNSYCITGGKKKQLNFFIPEVDTERNRFVPKEKEDNDGI